MNPVTAKMIQASGRSWWQARYSDGKVLSEWDTDPLISPLRFILKGNKSRWEEVPKKGMVGLRLLCPNGMAGELEAPEGRLFFQLKVGGVSVALQGGASQSYTQAHIIGVVNNPEGDCLCRAWEEGERKVSNEFIAAEYRVNHVVTPEDRQAALEKLQALRVQGYGLYHWRLIEFNDNVFDMQYRHIGRLNLDVQQLRV